MKRQRRGKSSNDFGPRQEVNEYGKSKQIKHTFNLDVCQRKHNMTVREPETETHACKHKVLLTKPPDVSNPYREPTITGEQRGKRERKTVLRGQSPAPQ